MIEEREVQTGRRRRRRFRRLRRVRVRRPKGLPTPYSRLRALIWSWWVWALGAAACVYDEKWVGTGIFVAVAVLAFLFKPREQAPTYGLDHEFAIESDEFVATIAGATDTPFSTGNRVDVYNNGDEFYPAMLEEIALAEESITIEAYIYWEGDIGRRFADALAVKARAGVTVKILLDSVGSSTISMEILKTLEDSGCQVQWYHPVYWYSIDRINNRTHRKSLIIDGLVGFTGGAGIADHWLGNADDPHHWRDIQIRIEGPAVTPLQTGFARNWLETTGELVSGGDYYPTHERVGDLRVQSILSSPETGSSTVRIMYYLSIVCARKSICIANPYFVPDETAIETLVDARRRGVEVKVMVAGIWNDNGLARHNSVRLYGDLLEAGVEIYDYNRTMLHQKYMVCDGIWTTIGTTNFDNRSFALNEENNVCVYDKAFAARFQEIFVADLADCDRVTLERWRSRSLLTKAAELLSSLLKEQV